jgi:Fur family zinc uptake transcriptional regulator|tara:strand:- start:8 stop:412 length:405 start_codon:yes stop_codon:yes gene_type:complete
MALATEKLTNNQQTVLDLLEHSKEPLKAYAILFNIQKKGIKSPLQVYRALDKLIEIGKVHKIESKNSFIACKHKNCDSTTSTSFLICETCDQVTELKKKNLSLYFTKQSDQADFKYTKHNLEIYGACKDCKIKH